MIQRFLFTKIEVWLLILILLLGFGGTVFFGFLVLDNVKNGGESGILGKISVNIARFPLLVMKILENQDKHESTDQTWPNQPGGFDFLGKLRKPNYILLNRHDGDVGYNVTEFIREGETVHIARWVFDDAIKYTYEPRSRFHRAVTEDAATMRPQHPLLDIDGNLTFHFHYAPLYQIDACSNLVWLNTDFSYHHSLELDADGNFWAPATTHTPLKEYGFEGRVKDDHLVKISQVGKTLFSKSIIEILIENKLINRMYVYDKFQKDPIHLNDIQPVFTNGPYWKRGDVFLSLGHLNMIALYRPSENKLLWWSQDLIMHQHDIDILDDSRIAVYNNNKTTRASGPIVIGNNEELVFDFTTGKTLSPWAKEFRKHDIRTDSQGLVDFSPDGSLLIEETVFGRLIKLSASGEKEWEYINKSHTGKVYTLNWVRYIESSTGNKIVKNLSESKCND